MITLCENITLLSSRGPDLNCTGLLKINQVIYRELKKGQIKLCPYREINNSLVQLELLYLREASWTTELKAKGLDGRLAIQSVR